MKTLTIQSTGIKRYPTYKASGINWLGEVPNGWNLIRLKYLVEIVKRIVGFEGPDVLSITQRGIKVKDVASGEGQLAMDYSKYQIVQSGDFAMNHMDLLTGYVDISKYNGVISPDYRVFRVKSDNVDPAYLLRLFQMCYKNKVFYYHGQGVAMLGRWRFPAENFKNFIIPVPPKVEQTAINNFLNETTAQIDKAIAQKEKLIKLLKERKQIIIQQTVTKGLDPNVKMKDSGVEWIGKIPEHWKVKRFRYVFNLSKGLTITKENLQDEGITCVNYGEIHSKYGFEVNPEIHELKCVDEEYLKSSPNALLKQGDFVFADTSEDIEGSGNFTYLNSSHKIFAGYHTVIARPKRIVNSRFFAFSFDSLSFRNQIRKKVKGVKVYSITQSILNEPYVWLPTLKEQEVIVAYLDKKCDKYDQSIYLNIKQIEKLKEYKATLIDSAVTGKIKVPGV